MIILFPVVGDPRGGFYLAEEVFSLARQCLLGVRDAVKDDDFCVFWKLWDEEQV